EKTGYIRELEFPDNIYISLQHKLEIENVDKKSYGAKIEFIDFEKILNAEPKFATLYKYFINKIVENNPKINPSLIRGDLGFQSIHTDINLLDGNKLDIEKFRNWREEYKNAIFILEDGSVDEPNTSPSGRSGGAFVVGREVEKMSKSKYNVQTPDELVEKFGADTLRCYEMFLGPLEQHKPWDTQGITGVHGFLKKLWRLFHTGENESFYVDETPILASADGSPHPSGELEGALK